MTRKGTIWAIWATVFMIPVFGGFAWAGFKISAHVAAPSSPAPWPIVYIAALACGVIILAAVVGRDRRRHRQYMAKVHAEREMVERWRAPRKAGTGF